MRLSSLLSCFVALGLLANGVFAQGEPPDLQPVGSVRYATLELATGELTLAEGPPQEPAGSTCFANTDTSGFYSTGLTPDKGEEWLDWGTFTPCSNGLVTGFVFGYGSTQLDVSEGGPGAELCLSFYSGTTGLCADSGAQPIASFTFTGLPAYTSGLATAFGLGWLVDVDLTGGFEFQMPAGPFGYSIVGGGDDFSGGAQTGPLLCYAGDGSSGTDTNGQVDLFDIWTPDVSGTCDGSFNFGGPPLDISSFYLELRSSQAGSCPWPETIVELSSWGGASILAQDIDGDGDEDVLTGAYYGTAVAWHENVAGDGSDWTKRTIVSSPDAASVAAGDIDGDGDPDVVAGLGHADVRWYRNGASGSSWTPGLITTSASSIQSVAVADLDGDGNLDALSASSSDHTIAWYENAQGDGSSWNERTITSSLGSASSVVAADIDGDGDLDVVAGAFSPSMVWFENVAGDASTWSTVQVSASPSRDIDVADLDADGDPDVLSGTTANVQWHENLASDGTVWADRLVDDSVTAVNSVFAADLDRDGDLDVLSGSGDYGSFEAVMSHENTNGEGTSWSSRSVAKAFSVPGAVSAADLDGDGDADVLCAYRLSKTVWYETPFAAGLRNAGTNPASYFATAPRLGATFFAGVDLTTTGHAFALVLGYRDALTLALGGGQTLLVDLTHPEGEVFGFAASAGPAAVFALDVPSDPGLCGMRVYSQAVHFGGGPPFALSNARDLVVGP